MRIPTWVRFSIICLLSLLVVLSISFFLSLTFDALCILWIISLLSTMGLFEYLEFPPASAALPLVERGLIEEPASSDPPEYTHFNAALRIPFGRWVINAEDEPLHLIAIGNTGTGKSSYLETCLLPRIVLGVGLIPDCGAIILDPKRELAPIVASLGVPFAIFNPIDERAWGWDIARDIVGEPLSKELASLLLSNQTQAKGDNAFFYQAAVLLLTAAIVGLQYALGERWDLVDLLHVISTKDTLGAFLKAHHPRPEETEDLLKTAKANDRNDIVNTIKSELDQFAVVAARWRHCKNRFTLDQVIRGDFVLLLGADQRYSELTKRTNGLLLSVLTARMLMLERNPYRRLWLVVDEAQASSKFIVGLEHCLSLGRSTGVCIAIAIQSAYAYIRELKDENLVKAIFGLCRSKVLLGMDSPTAAWVSQQIGSYEYWEPSTSTQQAGDKPPTTSLSYSLKSRPTLLPQELCDTHPQFETRTGIFGYFLSPARGLHSWRYVWNELNNWAVTPNSGVPAYLPLNGKDSRLQLPPLDAVARRRLGLPPAIAPDEDDNNDNRKPRRGGPRFPKPRK